MRTASVRSVLLTILAIGGCKPTNGEPVTSDDSSTPLPRNPDRPPGPVLAAPTWHVGDAWTVRYRLQQVTPRNDAANVEIFWDYRVVGISPTGDVEILTHRHPPGTWSDYHLFYSSAGRFIKYSLEYSHVDVPPEEHPFFSLETDWNAEALPKAWPAFPLESGKRIEFPEDVVQEVFDESAGLRVVLRVRGVDDYWQDRTMQQVWEPGRPWWSSIVIESVTQFPEGPQHYVEIEGVVIDWRPAVGGG